MIRARTGTDGTESDERAVSEVLSFVLVFGLVLGAVGVLSVAGLGVVDDHREAEQLRGAERGMTTLAAELDELARYGGLERRVAAVALGDGELTVADGGTEVAVAVDGDPVGEPIRLGELAYRSAAGTVAYDGGAVIRADEQGSRLRTRPTVACRGGTATVSLVRVQAGDRTVRTGGRTTVTARVADRSSETHKIEENVAVSTLETDYRRAWNGVEDDLDGCDADRLRLTVTTVSLET